MKNNEKIKDMEKLINNKKYWENLKNSSLTDKEIEKLMNDKKHMGKVTTNYKR